MSEVSSCGIYFDHVIDLFPEENAVIVFDPKAFLSVNKIELSPKEFALMRFESVKWIKGKADPDDRAWPYEKNNQHGCYSYDKEQRLLESRKTQQEKEHERKEEQKLKALYKKHGLVL